MDDSFSYISKTFSNFTIFYQTFFIIKIEGANVKVIGQYHSGLEHTFLWIVDAKDAHSVETLMVQAGIHSFNALTIVPLNTFDGVIEKCKQIENS